MQCPICQHNFGKLLHHFNDSFDFPLYEILQRKISDWTPHRGVCQRCADQAQIEAWAAFKGSSIGHQVNGYTILPLPTRLMAHPHYTGKNITIGFIDSGFCMHPDLADRVVATVNIPDTKIEAITSTLSPSDWHGTMTSVVGAGDGTLSNGIYKSLAPQAHIVLLKVADKKGIISGEYIAKAVHWAIQHQQQYSIRILNLSVTDDEATSYRENMVDRAIEQAVQAGIVVVAAAGNDTQAQLKAPANSPHAITVGGLDDHNTLHPLAHTLYHSTAGETVDGTYKPELIAPAIWIPAPILSGTKVQREAALLFELLQTQDDRYLQAKLGNVIHQLNMDKKIATASVTVIRQFLNKEIGQRKLISPYYQHADGTSFAAPIVSSLVAQMLEANPALTPAAIRAILIRTARRLPQVPSTRQGFGVVHPLSAVCQAASESHLLPAFFTPIIDYQQRVVTFYLHDHGAETVVATGDFNNWNPENIELQTERTGHWKVQYPMPPKGNYRYKLLVNRQKWMPDPTNLFRETDGFGGFHSKLIIE